MDCHICSKVLSRRDNLLRHVRTHHFETDSAHSHTSNCSTTGYNGANTPASDVLKTSINLKIRAASSLLLAGPSCSGKTTWILKLLDENILQ